MEQAAKNASTAEESEQAMDGAEESETAATEATAKIVELATHLIFHQSKWLPTRSDRTKTV